MKLYIEFVRSLLFLLILLVSDFPARAQLEASSGSFEKEYIIANPSLHYRYNAVSQTHDYADNWDLDGDGKMDQISFVGTGGAHLYYYLRIVLSSNHLIQNCRFLQTDLPILPPESVLNKPNFTPNINSTFFAIFQIQKHSVIFLKIDESTFRENKKMLIRHGIQTNKVMISVKKNKVIFGDYITTK